MLFVAGKIKLWSENLVLSFGIVESNSYPSNLDGFEVTQDWVVIIGLHLS